MQVTDVAGVSGMPDRANGLAIAYPDPLLDPGRYLHQVRAVIAHAVIALDGNEESTFEGRVGVGRIKSVDPAHLEHYPVGDRTHG